MASCHLLFSWEPLTFPIFLAGKRLQRGRPSTLCNASSHLMMPIIFSFFLTPSFSNFFFSILNPLFSTPQVQSIHFKKDLKNEGKIKRERSAWWEVGGGPGCPDPIDQIICTVKLPKHPWVTSLPQACVSCFFYFSPLFGLTLWARLLFQACLHENIIDLSSFFFSLSFF